MSTWLPHDRGADDGPALRGGMRWWLRLMLVLAFETTVVLGLWWALDPDATSRTASPGTFPTPLAIAALVLLVLVLAQASCRVPLWVWALVAVLLLPGLAVGARAVDGVAATTLEHVASAHLDDVTELDNGVYRASVTLPDGSTTTAYSVSHRDAHGSFFSDRTRDDSLLQLRFGPYERPSSATSDVLAGSSLTYARLVTGDDDEIPLGAVDWVFIVLALLLWLPIQAGAVSALVRRRGWWSRLGDRDVLDG